MLPAAGTLDSSVLSRISHLRGVRWRIYLCNLPRSSFDELRRVTADSRRRYAVLRKRLLVDPHVRKDGTTSPSVVIDNPLSESPDSMWGRFFRNAELEKLLDQDLSRLYPEHGSYFQTLGCQSMLRRILLLWCLRHPEYGYRQGMHELLAPLLYVIHADLQQLTEARKSHEGHFTDKFDDALFQENDLAYSFDFRRSSDFMADDASIQEKTKKSVSLDELDPDIQTIMLLSDPYGAEGELGIVLSEKFMEHDVYCMFDALMRGAGGALAMAEFLSPSTGLGTQADLSPVIEASSALYHLLSVVDAALYSHLVELGAEPQYFALRWLRVLFGREFSLEDLLMIWDEIFSFDNVKLGATDNEGSSFVSLNSHRGSFICAMAVSMMLNLRSSLLAMETATACLQKLLNFPRNIDLGKLIEKAKSLLPLALDANAPSTYAASGSHERIKASVVRGHSLSFDSASLAMPHISAPERYWEEKWRDMQKEEELKKDTSAGENMSMPKRGWTEKIKSRLYRAGSDPPIETSRRNGKEEQKPSVRRSLLKDLSNHLGDEGEDVKDNNSLNECDPSEDDSIVRPCYVETMGGTAATFSEESTGIESTSMISDAESPVRGSSSLENDLENSSVKSDVSNDMNGESQHTDPFHPSSEDQPSASHPSNGSLSPTVSESPESGAIGTMTKNKKSFSGKFQWFWKRGRHATEEEATGKVIAPKVIEHTKEENETSTMVAEPSEPYVSHAYRTDTMVVEPSEKQNGGHDRTGTEKPSEEQNGSDDITTSTPSEEQNGSHGTTSSTVVETSKELNGGHDTTGCTVVEPSEELKGGHDTTGCTVVEPSEELIGSHVSVNGNTTEQNLICSLRNLGQSMLENIQVIESAFQQDVRQASSGSLDNLSKNAIVGKGQVTAMSALTELRKISNLLSEM